MKQKIIINYGQKESTTISAIYPWPKYARINYSFIPSNRMALKRPKRGKKGQK